jgi:hypothetical protein
VVFRAFVCFFAALCLFVALLVDEGGVGLSCCVFLRFSLPAFRFFPLFFLAFSLFFACVFYTYMYNSVVVSGWLPRFFFPVFGGVSWLVLSLFLLLAVLVLLPVLCPVVGFGRVVLCLLVRVGLPLLLACLCRFLACLLLVRWVGCLLLAAFVFGFALGLRVRPCLLLVGCLFPLSRSRWLCLLAGVLLLWWRLFARCCRQAWLFPRLFLGWLRVAGVVAFAGSRSLGAAFAPLVRSAVLSVRRSGRSVAVGCCVGLDALVLSSLAPQAGSSSVCFAAFAVGGVGACSLSAVGQVAAFSSVGGAVSYWAGGGASVALPVRLAARSVAVVGAASVSCVVFFASPASRGSLFVASLAVGRGLPVFAFACGFCPSLLPLPGVGSWVAVGGSGVWSSAFRWVSAQAVLF